MEKEIQYMPVGRVRRRRRTWRRTVRDLVRMLMAGGELIGTGILAGAGFRRVDFRIAGFGRLRRGRGRRGSRLR